MHKKAKPRNFKSKLQHVIQKVQLLTAGPQPPGTNRFELPNQLSATGHPPVFSKNEPPTYQR
jgi:hypothetical protein